MWKCGIRRKLSSTPHATPSQHILAFSQDALYPWPKTFSNTQTIKNETSPFSLSPEHNPTLEQRITRVGRAGRKKFTYSNLSHTWLRYHSADIVKVFFNFSVLFVFIVLRATKMTVYARSNLFPILKQGNFHTKCI